MAAIPDFAVIKSALSDWKKEIKQKVDLVSLFKEPFDIMQRDWEAQIEANIEHIGNSTELKAAQSKINKIVNELVQAVPADLSGKAWDENVLHSQLTLMSQRLFLSDNGGENVASLMKFSKDSTKGIGDEVKSMVKDLKNQVTPMIDDLKGMKDDPNIVGLKSKIESSILPMKDKFQETKDKVLRLESRVLSGGDFSKERINSLLSSFSGLKTLLPSMSAVSGMFTQTQSEVKSLPGTILDKFNTWKTTATNLVSYKDNILASIKPGDLFKQNFSKILSTFESGKSNLKYLESSIKNGVTPKSVQAISGIISDVNSMSGMIKTLGNRKFSDVLKDVASPVVQQMNAFKDQVQSALNPQGLIDSVEADLKKAERDVKAVFQSAEKILKGKIPNIGVLDSIKGRLEATAASIENKVNSFTSILNSFEPAVTADAKAFMDSLGQTAPAAKDAILTGNIGQFEKTLKDPQYLTIYGQAVAEFKEFTKAEANKLSVSTTAKINSLVSELSGQHKKQMMGMWLSNLPAQRSQALKSMDIFVRTTIGGLEQTANELKADIKIDAAIIGDQTEAELKIMKKTFMDGLKDYGIVIKQ